MRMDLIFYLIAVSVCVCIYESTVYNFVFCLHFFIYTYVIFKYISQTTSFTRLFFVLFLSFMCFYFSLEKPSAPRTNTQFLVFFSYHFVVFFVFATCFFFILIVSHSVRFLFQSWAFLFGHNSVGSGSSGGSDGGGVYSEEIELNICSLRSLAFEIWFNKIFLRSFNLFNVEMAMGISMVATAMKHFIDNHWNWDFI